MQMAKYMVRWFLLESLLLLCVVFVLWFIWAIIKFSFSLFVHDSSFTMVKCRKCSTLSIRQRKCDEPTFSVFLSMWVQSLLCRPLLQCHSKNIFDFASRNHMQRAAARLSQQLWLLLRPIQQQQKQHCAAAKKTEFIRFFSSAFIVVPAIYNKAKKDWLCFTGGN